MQRLCDCVLQNLHKQLEEAIQDGEIWVMQLKDTEYELEGSRERVQQQATEILHKASKIGLLPHWFVHSHRQTCWRTSSYPVRNHSDFDSLYRTALSRHLSLYTLRTSFAKYSEWEIQTGFHRENESFQPWILLEYVLHAFQKWIPLRCKHSDFPLFFRTSAQFDKLLLPVKFPLHLLNRLSSETCSSIFSLFRHSPGKRAQGSVKILIQLEISTVKHFFPLKTAKSQKKK